MGDRRSERYSHSGDRDHEGRDRDRDWDRHKRHKSGFDGDERDRRRDDWSRDRDRDYHGGGRRDGRDREDSVVPTPVLVLRNLHPDTTQEKILYTLKAYGPVNDVRLIRDKGTGESRGFAFVEFPSVAEAQKFLEYHNMRLDLDGRIVYMDYSKQKEPHAGSEYKDWICPQCSMTNFSRRAVCYTCQAPKPSNPVLVSQGHEDSAEPGPVLALRGLDPSTVEAAVYATFVAYAPVKEVRLVREKGTNVSRGFCFVEFHSVEDATYVLHNCHQVQVDGLPVRLSYARKGQSERHHHHHQQQHHQQQQQHQQQQYNVANAALEQAHLSTGGLDPALAHAQTEAASHTQARLNELGFYYDAQSGYFYNSGTGYCYHPTSQTYYYFDPATQAPVPVTPDVALAAQPLAAAAAAATAAGGVGGIGTSADAPAHGGAAAAPVPTPAEIAVQEAEKAAKKEKKKKAKSLRDKKMSQELERWMKKTQELKHEDAKDAAAQATEALSGDKKTTTGAAKKITISFGTTNKLLLHPPATAQAGDATSATTIASTSTPVAATQGGEAPSSSFLPSSSSSSSSSSLAPSVETAGQPQPQPALFLPINEGGVSSTPPDTAARHQDITTTASTPASSPEQAGSSSVAAAAGAEAAARHTFPQQSARPDVGLDFVCLLCRCKFVRARTLDLHIQLSKPHKTNQESAHEAEVEQIRELTRSQQKDKSADAHHHHRHGHHHHQHEGSRTGAKKRRRESAANATPAAAPADSDVSGKTTASAAGAALGEGIGGQMLKRMGWKQGEGLGKDATGMVNPIEVSRRSERAGLGAEEDMEVELDPNDTYQDVAKKKARARLESMMVHRDPSAS